MKKYIIMIVLISLMPQLRAVDRSNKTLALKNLTSDDYTVNYSTREKKSILNLLRSKEYVKLPVPGDELTSLSFLRKSSSGLSVPHQHDVDIDQLKRGYDKHKTNALEVFISRDMWGNSKYEISMDLGPTLQETADETVVEWRRP